MCTNQCRMQRSISAPSTQQPNCCSSQSLLPASASSRTSCPVAVRCTVERILWPIHPHSTASTAVEYAAVAGRDEIGRDVEEWVSHPPVLLQNAGCVHTGPPFSTNTTHIQYIHTYTVHACCCISPFSVYCCSAKYIINILYIVCYLYR